MPGPELPSFPEDKRLPKSVDTVVIGGGIVGASTALELAARGVSVLLCEKGRIGGEQSSRNWGWVRLSQRDPREIPLMIESMSIWQGLEARTGYQTGYHRCGSLFVANTDKRRDHLQRWAQNLQDFDATSEILSGDTLQMMLPGHEGHIPFALSTPMDGRAEPQLATHAIAMGARDAGAVVLSNCAVRSVDVQAGQIAGVITERGRVACSSVVVAGGAWSRLFLGNAGISLPQLKVLNSVLRCSAVTGGPDVALWGDGYGLTKRADGGYTVANSGESTVDIVPDSFRLGLKYLPAFLSEWRSLRFRLSDRWQQEAAQARRWTPDQETAFEQCRILDPEPSQSALKSGWTAAQQAFPFLQQSDVVQSWAGMIDVMPDAIPVISAVDDLPGLYISTGFSGHGFGLGPGAGRLMADMVTGSTPIVDPHAFRLSRYTDGSRVRIDNGA
ncbi:NAD(P)/FAD-dependent oxidoreductase [Parasedimentitalea huanghaiensis]|uniref:FAD-dependent oxidoreductase n=1 Tax=Parasedimentitalea huanghaiensis TaxID=2682100 RepID=A0A6L6WH59_9RHOB|nr:FAD-binding oxidoreductase [Zongyanglinia huanghaiensis]MVO17183.1 FAD-dependent oxidoreductase [Zongyanglinia huanghaiensis]